MNGQDRLAHFPITFFASVMGVVGLSIAWQRAEAVFLPLRGVGEALLWLGWGIFLLVAALYLFKALRHREEVVQEFNHPVRANFFATIPISMMLLSIATGHRWIGLSESLWVAGAGIQIIFTVLLVGRWLTRSFELPQVNPAWFLPAVGNIIAPLGAVEWGYTELGWFYFSVGLFFWLLLCATIMQRLMFGVNLPEKLQPTFFILIAPPAVGFLSYVRLTAATGLDPFSRLLFYVACFFAILLLSLGFRFCRLPFYMSWWAFTFPFCALSIAATTVNRLAGGTVFSILATLCLGMATVIVAGVLARTLMGAYRSQICRPEE